MNMQVEDKFSLRGLRIAAPIVALCLGLIVAAQPAHSQALNGWGLKAGITSSGVGDEYRDFTNQGGANRQVGFEVFLFAEWLRGGVFSVVTELGYAQRGFKEGEQEMRDEQNFPIRTSAPSLKFGYVSTMALGKARYAGAALSPYLAAGPRLDILAHSSGDYYLWHVGIPVPERLQHPAASEYAGVTFGLTLALGTEFRLSEGRDILLEGRYAFDFTDSLSDFEWTEARNTAFSLLLGVRL